MDKIKSWLLEVALKKMAPSAVRAILAVGLGFIAAHSGILEKIGVVYDKAANDLILHLTTTTEFLVALGVGSATALLSAGQHHVEEAIKPPTEKVG